MGRHPATTELETQSAIRPARVPRECLILAYHRTNEFRGDWSSVRTTRFREQLESLMEAGYANVSLEELVARIRDGAPPLGKCFAITFDDGYRDGFTDALPVLKDLGCRATFFLVADLVAAERPFPWDVGRLAGIGPADHAMNDREVGELLDAGMSIGSHTCTHPLLATVDIATVRLELERSKSDLERRFRVPVDAFCYPAGSLNASVVAEVERAGYTSAVVTPPRPGIPETLFTLKRVGVYGNDTPVRFRLKVHPAFTRMREAQWYWAARRLLIETRCSSDRGG